MSIHNAAADHYLPGCRCADNDVAELGDAVGDSVPYLIIGGEFVNVTASDASGYRASGGKPFNAIAVVRAASWPPIFAKTGSADVPKFAMAESASSAPIDDETYPNPGADSYVSEIPKATPRTPAHFSQRGSVYVSVYHSWKVDAAHEAMKKLGVTPPLFGSGAD